MERYGKSVWFIQYDKSSDQSCQSKIKKWTSNDILWKTQLWDRDKKWMDYIQIEFSTPCSRLYFRLMVAFRKYASLCDIKLAKMSLNISDLDHFMQIVTIYISILLTWNHQQTMSSHWAPTNWVMQNIFSQGSLDSTNTQYAMYNNIYATRNPWCYLTPFCRLCFAQIVMQKVLLRVVIFCP